MSPRNSGYMTVVKAVLDRKDSFGSDERYTPMWVLELAQKIMGGIDLDPCADPLKRVPAERHFTKDDNGLEQSWFGRVWLNPPFSNSGEWVKHLSIYFHAGSVSEAIVLVPTMTLSNKAFRLLMRSTASCFTLLDGRLAFKNQDYEDMPNAGWMPFALVYLGSNSNRFLKLTSPHGLGCVLHEPDPQSKVVCCSYCGKPFKAKRSTAKFCSTTCRVEAHRKRQSSPTTRASS